ncbi:VanZ family protein [Mucilaginibacter ginsenosidivorax]|uniref:VanZ family protein n=1 Tax=Mucilaginibacter ginsenosidivorax TaxID=862126 RepID=A0A5B8W4P7_9SPHI|nr:VanZ family protein [Mucilaginibacter ginsenosidivorax]QEC77318.1 VanZ family protein [Mucilaginibacter ginsenosidivorax]
MKATLKYQGPAILWALFILIICSVNLGSAGDSPMFFKGFDKLTHTGLFFTLVVLFCNGIIRQQKPRPLSYTRALIIVIAAIVFGGLIEILQLEFFPWRSAEWSDFFCDGLGACMGIFGVMLTINAIGNEKK